MIITTLPETFSLSEQLPPDPYTDAGTDDWNDKSRYCTGRAESDQSKKQTTDKAAEYSKKDILNQAGFLIHERTCYAPGDSSNDNAPDQPHIVSFLNAYS